SRIENVEFVDGDLHRQKVEWGDGGEVWVNRGQASWQVKGHLLPQYGFLARVPCEAGAIEAGIVRRNGVIVEWSFDPETIYANARPVVLNKASQSGRLSAGPDLRPTRMNPEGKLISFGAVSTNGGARLTREGDSLVVTPLPEGPYFVLSVDWAGLPWTFAETEHVEAIDEDQRVLWTVPVSMEEGRVRLTCEPGVFAYRFR
ncbi:MAG: hypothetical protein ACWGQW_19385, partial [bacterium]